MIFTNSKIVRNALFTGVLGIVSLSAVLIIDAKPSLATSISCQKPVSVPDSYPLVGVLAFSIFGGGYLLRQRLSKKGYYLKENDLVRIDDFSPSFEFQVIDPTEII